MTKEELIALVEEFVLEWPMANPWRYYPAVEPEEQMLDCIPVSAALARFLTQRGHEVEMVHGDDAEPAGFHRWIRVDGLNVDLTARQYYALPGEAGRKAAESEWPLIWEGDGHPIVDFGITISMLAEPVAFNELWDIPTLWAT